MSKIAFIFPGVGYHTDKPLLYYGKKLAKQQGYKVMEVPYTGFASGIKGNPEKMREVFESALKQTEEILAKEEITEKDEILIVSKSVGTVVAGAWQMRHGIASKNIYFTPVEATFQFAKAGNGIVFHGTSDSWVETYCVEEACKRLELPLYLTENGDHSLEVGDVVQDTQEIAKVIEICKEYISESGMYRC